MGILDGGWFMEWMFFFFSIFFPIFHECMSADVLLPKRRLVLVGADLFCLLCLKEYVLCLL